MSRRQSEFVSEVRLETYEERREKVKGFNMTSDVFFGKVLEDEAACQEVIQILLAKPDFTVRKVKAQYSIRNVENHSVTLDVLAEDVEGRLINIEMQVSEKEDHQKRVRYYQSSIDMSYLEKGVPYDQIPEVYMIFITLNDFLDQKSGIYYIERMIRNHGTVVDNGIHEVYANLQYPCGDEKMDELLAYFKNSDSSYQTATFPNVVRKVRFLKEKEEGVEIMCRILEKERSEGRREGRREGKSEVACNLFAKGFAVEEVAGFVDEDMTVVEAWYKDWRESLL